MTATKHVAMAVVTVVPLLEQLSSLAEVCHPSYLALLQRSHGTGLLRLLATLSNSDALLSGAEVVVRIQSNNSFRCMDAVLSRAVVNVARNEMPDVPLGDIAVEDCPLVSERAHGGLYQGDIPRKWHFYRNRITTALSFAGGRRRQRAG
jgi:hypothetical protein